MSRQAHILRFFGSTALLLVAVLGTIPVANNVSAQQDGASIELHKRACPPGYSANNYYQDCHDTPMAGITFELGGLRPTTGADGNVLFTNLIGGAYTITENLPGDAVDVVVYCSIGGDPQNTAAFEYVPGGIILTVPENSAIICDWYNIPYELQGAPGNGDASDQTGSSVEIHARLCPPGYTGNQPYEVCHDNPLTGATFTLDGLTATTGANGNTLFYNLVPQQFTLTQVGQGGFWSFTVFCSRDAHTTESVPVTLVPGGIQIDLPANTAVVCDWYNIPEAVQDPGNGTGPGSLTIHQAECPPGYEDQAFYQDCHENRVAGVRFDAFGPEGYLRGVTTDENGVLVLDGMGVGGTVSVYYAMPPGTAGFVVFCSDGAGNRVPFDYVDDGTNRGIRLSVFRGDSVLCDWYNIPTAS